MHGLEQMLVQSNRLRECNVQCTLGAGVPITKDETVELRAPDIRFPFHADLCLNNFAPFSTSSTFAPPPSICLSESAGGRRGRYLP